MGPKKIKAPLIAENEATRRRLETLVNAGNGGRGGIDHFRVAEAVGEPNRRLEIGSESLPVGCIVRDKKFRVTGWNPAAEET